MIVLTSLIACLTFLAFRSLWQQRAERVEIEAPAVAVAPTLEPRPASRPAPVERPEVLMNPGFVYRCIERGKVAYSDRPCTPDTPGRAGK